MAPLRRYLSLLAAFLRKEGGVAAVEFAIILPLAVLLYAGAAQVSDGVMTSRKVATVTRSLVDLLSAQATSSQATSTPAPSNAVPETTLAGLLTSAATLMSPQPLNSLTMTISAIDVFNTSAGICCKATVRWSYTQDGTLRPCGVQLTGSSDTTPALTQMPEELLPVGTPLLRPLSFLVSDVNYTYQPIMASSILNFVPTMQRTLFMMPRSIGQVVTGPLSGAGAQHGQVCY